MLLKEAEKDRIELALTLSQIKKLYRALFRQLHQGGAGALDEFDEDDMLITLQTYLQRRAREAGVDATIHEEWERFLGVEDPQSCTVRFAKRQQQ